MLHLGERCLVMGILNASPDSFAERQGFRDPASAADFALRMESEGADLIDIGGESTWPGAEPVSADQDVPISIDTYKAEVARAAVAAGAALVNDVSGLRVEPGLAREVAAGGAALVLTHSRGRAKTMNAEAVYDDLMAEVSSELRDSLRRAVDAGVPTERIIVDPGVGFAKRPSHSYGVLARLPDLAAALDRPVLVGPSRKSFLREAVGGRPAAERDWGTAAAVTAAVLAGAHIVRVHAIAEMVQVVRVAEEIRKYG
ncbi:MAG: dihydropteroate synthase [Acidobacteria bacterium]|nr:MAG: dihydropteroate synthase [Acidobacteriota bacterium]